MLFEIHLINVINNRLERIIVPSVITCQYFALFCLQNSSKQTEIALTFYNGQLSEGLGTSAGKLRPCADKLIKKQKSFFLSFNVRLLSLSALVSLGIAVRIAIYVLPAILTDIPREPVYSFTSVDAIRCGIL